MSSSKPKTFAVAAVVAVTLTLVVRSRFGNEAFLCEGEACTLGSGTKWLMTGLALIGPFLAAVGYQWSGLLEKRNMLDPTAKWAVPDAEQILEGLAVLFAGLATYWLILNGPATEAVDIRQVNDWANDLRNFRLEENAPSTDLVPSRLTWFVIGALLAVPFFFSFGSMLGRELFGRRRRKAMLGESLESAEHDELGAGHDDIDSEEPEADGLDPDEVESNEEE